jgi:hypothetical protein
MRVSFTVPEHDRYHRMTQWMHAFYATELPCSGTWWKRLRMYQWQVYFLQWSMIKSMPGTVWVLWLEMWIRCIKILDSEVQVVAHFDVENSHEKYYFCCVFFFWVSKPIYGTIIMQEFSTYCIGKRNQIKLFTTSSFLSIIIKKDIFTLPIKLLE